MIILNYFKFCHIKLFVSGFVLEKLVVEDFFDVKQAACRGKSVSLFYPSHTHKNVSRRQEVLLGKELCSKCAVALGCLDYALHYEPLGIWGGTTEVEREILRRRKQIFLQVDRRSSDYVERSIRSGKIDREVRRTELGNE